MGTRSPLPRLAGVSTVMRTLPPQPPEGHQRADAVVMKVRGDCTRYGKSTDLFSIREKCRVCFSHPRCINQKQLITITDNETIDGRPRHQTTALRYATKHHRQSGKSLTSPTGISLTVDITTRLPEWANGLATA